MFKLTLSLYFLNVAAYAFALHNFLPSEVAKRNIYTNFVPPSAERFFAPAAAASNLPSAKQTPTSTHTQTVAPLLASGASAPYLAASAYPYQTPQYTQYTQYSPYTAFKQYPPPNPYYPGVFYPPQQFVYPGAVGPSPVVYIPRYPAPAESGNEPGSSSGGQPGWGSYIPSNWQSWGSNWGSYFPSWPGSGSSESAEAASPATPVQGSSSQTGASASASSNRAKPEKLEAAEATPAPAASQDSAKLDTDKNAVTVELPEQQYVLLGQPQYFGHFAAFPGDRDPTTLNNAAKGAVSSFLFYNDQNQHIASQPQPQRFNDITNTPASASIAYQRFLLLSKQRSEDGPKPANKSESQPSSATLDTDKEISQSNSNSTAAATSDATSPEPSPAKSSEDGNGGGGGGGGAEIAQVTPNAVAYAGIGGVAGAAPIGTAFVANSGYASSAPRATAIAGTSDQSPDFAVVPAKTISVARYTPQRKYHIDTIAHGVNANAAGARR